MARTYTGLTEYLDRRLGSHSGNGPEYQYYCPFCIDRLGDESDKKKLWVNTSKGVAVCYRCGFGARSIRSLFKSMNGGRLLAEERDIIKGEVARTTEAVNKQVIMILYGDKDEKLNLRRVYTPREMIPLAPEFDSPRPLSRVGVRYLKGRGCTKELAETFHIGYCPTGEYAGYLVFPVWQGSEQVYFTTRFAGNSPLKSKNPKNRDGYYDKSHCLLNFDNVIGAEVVTIAEGPFSVMAHEHGVGLMGKTISDEQIGLLEVLAAYGTKEFVVSLDADAGMNAEQVYDDLVDRLPKVTLLSLSHGDPDDNKGDLPTLMEGRGEPTLADRVGLRLSGDALKKPLKNLAMGRTGTYTPKRNQRGGRR